MTLRSRYDLVFGVSLCLVLLSFFEMYSGGVRYFKYAVIPLVFLAWVGSRDFLVFRLKREHYAFWFFLLGAVVYSPFLGIYAFKDVVLIFSALLIFVLFEDRKLDVNRLFSVVVVSFVMANLPRIDGFLSVGGVEDNFSFVFGLFGVYFLLKRDFVRACVTLVLVLITLKRIALIGFVSCGVLSLMPFVFQRRVLSPVVMVFLNSIVLMAASMFALGFFDDFIVEFFDMHPAALSSGRYQIQRVAAEYLYFDFSEFFWIGLGPGKSVEVGSMSFGVDVLLHNDLMKLALEYGILFFLVFFFLLYLGGSLEVRLLAAYMNVTFFTDNTLIYAGVLFFYFALVSSLKVSDGAHKSTSSPQRI